MEKTSIPCAFDFENHHIGKVCYFSTTGFCSECKSSLSVILVNEPSSGPVYFEAVAEKVIFKVPHSGCRRLAGPKRKTIGKELLNQLPKKWQRKQVATLTHTDNCSHLYKLTSLQKARADAKNEELGIVKGLNLFESLAYLKANNQYGHYIRDIGFDPFYLFFWSQSQIDIHNDVLKHLGNSTSSDSTGSICTSIKRPGQKIKHIFLTILMINVEKKSVVTCQMLSEKNDANAIAYWIREFLRSGAEKPLRLVTDKGMGFRNGLCLGFNNVPMKQYNNIILLLLKNELKPHSLSTQMALDISHLMHLPERWPNFTKMPAKVQQLYRHCIGILSTIEDLTNFEQFFKAVVTLALSKTCNSKCTEASQYIINLIKSFEFDENIKSEMCDTTVNSNQDLDEAVKIEESYPEEDDESSMKQYIMELVDSIDLQNLTDHELLLNNDYYYPEFAERFIELCHDFPCCTNVALKIFGIEEKVATSSRCENAFRDVKDNVLSQRITMRPDKFVIQYCQNVDSDVMLRRSELNNIILKRRNEKRSINVQKSRSSKYLLHSDRWKKYGQNESINELQSESEQLIDEVNLNGVSPSITDIAFNDSNTTEQIHLPGDTSFSFMTAASSPGNLKVEEINSFEKKVDHNYAQCNNEEKLINVETAVASCPQPNSRPLSVNVTATEQIDLPSDTSSILMTATSSPVNLKIEEINNQEKLINVMPAVASCPQLSARPLSMNLTAIELKNSDIKLEKVLPQKNKTKRGFYVSPNPDIELDLQIPKRKKQEVHVIQNGLRKGGKKSIHGVMYRFMNTCSWDSDTEIIMRAITHLCSKILSHLTKTTSWL